MLAEHASELYAKNLLSFLQLLIHDGELKPDWSDEVIAKAALTRAGVMIDAAPIKQIQAAE
jgi:NAD(P) transhydrogenase subunit alpha